MKYTLTMLSCFLFGLITAQQSTISGVVTDKSTGEPLIGATVSFATEAFQNTGTVTDVNGSFVLKYGSEVAQGTRIQVEYLGYDDYLIIFSSEEAVYHKVKMTESSTLIQTTTITGSRYEKSLAKSPVSLSVIKPELIEQSNSTIMNEFLDKVPGLTMIDGQANIRGGSGYSYGAGSRALLLIDDVPALQADAGRPLWDDIPIENVSQIEVLKGASSALYGSAALNGIINIRTGYATSEPQTKVFATYTHYMAPSDPVKHWWKDTGYTPFKFTTAITHKQKFGKLDVVGTGFYETFDQVRRDNYKNRYRLSANLKYRLSDRLTLAMNTMYNYKDSASFLLWDNARDGAYIGWEGTESAGVTKRYYIDPQLTYYDNGNNKHKILSRYYKLSNGSITNQATRSDNLYLEYQYTGAVKELDLEYTAGVSGYWVRSNSELYGSVDLNNANLAAFAQVDKSFGPLTVTLGSRYEHNQQSNPMIFLGDSLGDLDLKEGRLVNRLGLNYELNDQTYLRTSWGQGYRYPSIAERFIFTDLGGFFILPNPDLESESGWTAEVGIKRSITIGEHTGYVDLSLFRSEYENMMEFTFGNIEGIPGFQSQNVGNTQINGLELEIVGGLKIGPVPIKLLGGYTYIDPSYKDFESNETIQAGITEPLNPGDDPNVLKYRSKHNMKMDATIYLKKLSLGIAYNRSSQIATIDRFLSLLNEIQQYREANPDPFYRLDTRVAYDFGKFKIGANVNNLTNHEYSKRPGVLEIPRNISVRLDYDF